MSLHSRASFATLAILALSCGGPQSPAPPTPVPIVDAGPTVDETGDPDSDGVVGSNDLCPTEAEDRDGFEDGNGCPDPDNDNDRIPDVTDECPLEPEVYNGKNDDDGCPDGCLGIPGDMRIRILPRTMFEKRSAALSDEAESALVEAAKILAANPQVDRVLAAGYTSKNEGNAKAKLDLSRKRAEAVVAHLVAAGVPAERLVAAGFGANCPLDERQTEAARAKNRRVDFRVLSIDLEPTGVELTCPAAAKLVPESERKYIDAQKPIPPPPETLSQWEIRDALAKSMETIRSCNGAGFRDPTGPAVRFDMKLEIDPLGTAHASLAKKGDGFNADVAACVKEVVENTHFPTARLKTTIIYPFIIEPESSP